jgi:hypothetical protein
VLLEHLLCPAYLNPLELGRLRLLVSRPSLS